MVEFIQKPGAMLCKKTPFFEWLGDEESSFRSLGKFEKEKVFLRWKWGSKDHVSNSDCDKTEQFILGSLSDEEKLKPFWATKIRFSERCKEIKIEIGLQRDDRGDKYNGIVKGLNEKFKSKRPVYAGRPGID